MEDLYFVRILLCAGALLAFYATTTEAASARILIYSATKGFRHDSIPTAIAALKAQGVSIDVEFDATEDPSQFTDGILANYDSLLFLSTTGEVLDDTGKAAFQTYLNRGGTFVGVHSASDTLRNTTSYVKELGALFDYHPPLQNFTVDILDASHPSTSMLSAQWHVQDEAYNFESDPRALGATVVLSADESTYVDTGVRRFNQGTPHPTAWFQEKGAGVEEGGIVGRSFYTSLGHLNETWQDELFMSHVLGGISWVLLGNTTRAFNSTGLVGNSQPQTGRSSTSPSVSAGAASTTMGTQPGSTLSPSTQGDAKSSGRMVKSITNTALFLVALGQCLVALL